MTKTILISALLACCWFLTLEAHISLAGEATSERHLKIEHLPVEYVQFQGLRRTVRFYRPAHLADKPALLLVLHGGGGDGERFRHLTGGAFELLADKHGFLIAYPDALGGHWNGCRARASYHAALAGIDDVGFLRAVVRRAREIAARDLAGVFVVGYSNGGHLVFRIALEAPTDFAALATIGANLPVSEELGCIASNIPVSILLVSGTDDPINPWEGGEVRAPGGKAIGHVRSAEATAAYFRGLAGIADRPKVEEYPDLAPEDGTRVETRRWTARGGQEIILMAIRGGGHTLPHPAAAFPFQIVGRTSRDLDGAAEIWNFFVRHLGSD